MHSQMRTLEQHAESGGGLRCGCSLRMINTRSHTHSRQDQTGPHLRLQRTPAGLAATASTSTGPRVGFKDWAEIQNMCTFDLYVYADPVRSG